VRPPARVTQDPEHDLDWPVNFAHRIAVQQARGRAVDPEIEVEHENPAIGSGYDIETRDAEVSARRSPRRYLAAEVDHCLRRLRHGDPASQIPAIPVHDLLGSAQIRDVASREAGKLDAPVLGDLDKFFGYDNRGEREIIDRVPQTGPVTTDPDALSRAERMVAGNLEDNWDWQRCPHLRGSGPGIRYYLPLGRCRFRRERAKICLVVKCGQYGMRYVAQSRIDCLWRVCVLKDHCSGLAFS